MPKAPEIKPDNHLFIFNESTYLLLSLTLSMVRFMRFDYPDHYKAAIDSQFPGLFDEADTLWDSIDGVEPSDEVEFSDDEIYTLYICHDLMGRILVSDLYESVIEGIYKENNFPVQPETMKLVYQHSLSNIQPFLMAAELYAQQTDALPMLGTIKNRLGKLPMLDN